MSLYFCVVTYNAKDYDRHFTTHSPDLRIPRRDREGIHLARTFSSTKFALVSRRSRCKFSSKLLSYRRQDPPGYHRPAGHPIGETEYNIIRVWKETLQQYRFLYDIQQRSVEDHCTKLFFKPVQSVFVSNPLQAFTSFAIPYRGYFYFNSRKLYPKGVVFLKFHLNYTRKGVIILIY